LIRFDIALKLRRAGDARSWNSAVSVFVTASGVADEFQP